MAVPYVLLIALLGATTLLSAGRHVMQYLKLRGDRVAALLTEQQRATFAALQRIERDESWRAGPRIEAAARKRRWYAEQNALLVELIDSGLSVLDIVLLRRRT